MQQNSINHYRLRSVTLLELRYGIQVRLDLSILDSKFNAAHERVPRDGGLVRISVQDLPILVREPSRIVEPLRLWWSWRTRVLYVKFVTRFYLWELWELCEIVGVGFKTSVRKIGRFNTLGVYGSLVIKIRISCKGFDIRVFFFSILGPLCISCSGNFIMIIKFNYL